MGQQASTNMSFFMLLNHVGSLLLCFSRGIIARNRLPVDRRQWIFTQILVFPAHGSCYIAAVAIGDVVIVIRIMGIFIADQPSAPITGSVEADKAAAAEGNAMIALILVPEDPFSAAVTGGGQFIKTTFTLHLSS